MSKLIEKLGIFMILVSGGLAWAGDYFSNPGLGSIGIILFGLWVVAWGVDVAVKGEVTLINSQRRRHEFFSGIPAGLWSAIFITAGLGILFLGWLDLSSPGGSEGFLERVLSSPAGWGTLLGIIGMVTTASGVIRMISGSGSISGRVGNLEEFGYRAGGVVRTLFGSGLILLAAGLLIAPEVVKALFDGLVEFITTWLFG